MTISKESEISSLNQMLNRLWPLCRSVAGEGFRASLDILSERVPFTRLSYPSGTRVFDWTVPDEWNVKEAYFVDPTGKRHASFSENNLHLVSHSEPFRGRLPLAELKKHLHSLPEQPGAIPYLTSYYKRRWGFCLTHLELQSLPEGNYEVVIDAELRPGNLVVGEAVLPGKRKHEVLLSTYLCHPSLANNELSGPLALVALYERLAGWKDRNYSYRFVVSAETVGTICYLSTRGDDLKKRLRAGFQLTCVGDRGSFTFKTSRRTNSLADRAGLEYLKARKLPFTLENFDPGNGSDERQYCSPGFDLPVASLMRTMYSRYPEYHTSLDDRSFLSVESLVETVDAYEGILRDIDSRRFFLNLFPNGEPQLGSRGLYPDIGSTHALETKFKGLMYVLNYSDGRHDLKDISEKCGLPLPLITEIAEELAQLNVITEDFDKPL